MFFYLSKLVWFVVVPSTFLILISLCGAMLTATRLARTGRIMAVSSAILLLIAGLSPLATLLAIPLESRFPEWRGEHAPDGVIILGGGLETPRFGGNPRSIEVSDAGERLLALIELAQRFPDARLVYSGGVSNLDGKGIREATLVKERIGNYGVNSARLIAESEARTTAENATLTFEMMRPKPNERWLLVTSAWHMPRAVGSFRRAGFAVEAYPVDYMTGSADWLRPFNRAGAGLHRFDQIVKEWVGLVAYRITGRTDALLPGP